MRKRKVERMKQKIMIAVLMVVAMCDAAGAQAAAVWTKIVAENYASPVTVTVTVPTNQSVTVRWGSGTTFVTRVFTPGTNTFLAGNSTFGDPTPGVAKELDVQGTDVSDFIVGGQQLANPAPTVVDMIVTPMMITATTGTVVQTKAMCKYSDGTVVDCTNKATFTYVKGGVAAYNGTGAIVGTQAGPAEVDVSMAAITVKLSVLIVDLPIYFNGGLMLGSN